MIGTTVVIGSVRFSVGGDSKYSVPPRARSVRARNVRVAWMLAGERTHLFSQMIECIQSCTEGIMSIGDMEHFSGVIFALATSFLSLM